MRYRSPGIADTASRERGVSRSAVDKIIESVSDELLAGYRRFDHERFYAMLLGALPKHLKNDCVAMSPSERFDYIVSVFSEGSLRRFPITLMRALHDDSSLR